MRERPSDAASKPGACGDSSGRAVSAPRTMVARRSRGVVPKANSSIIVSKVQVSPRWLQKTFSMSNGTPPKHSATSTTSDGATNKNAARGSTKRRTEPGAGDAVDLGASAGHPNSSSPSINGRQLGEGNQRKLLLLPSFKSPFEHLGWNTLISK